METEVTDDNNDGRDPKVARKNTETEDHGVLKEGDSTPTEIMMPEGGTPRFTEELARYQLRHTFLRIQSGLDNGDDYDYPQDMALDIESALVFLSQFPKLASEKFPTHQDTTYEDFEEQLPIVFFFDSKVPLAKLKQVFALFPDPGITIDVTGWNSLKKYCNYTCMSKQEYEDFQYFICHSLPQVAYAFTEIGDFDAIYRISQSQQLCLLHEIIRQKLKKEDVSSDHLNHLTHAALLSNCPDDILKMIPVEKIEWFQENLRFCFYEGDIDFNVRFEPKTTPTYEYLMGVRNALFEVTGEGICGNFFHAMRTIFAKPWCPTIHSLEIRLDIHLMLKKDVESLVYVLHSCKTVAKIVLKSMYELDDEESLPKMQILLKAFQNRDTPLDTLKLTTVPFESALDVISSSNGARNLELSMPASATIQRSATFDASNACVKCLNVRLKGTFVAGTLESFFGVLAYLPNIQNVKVIEENNCYAGHKPIDLSSSVCDLLINAASLQSVIVACESICVDAVKVYSVLKGSTNVKTFLVCQNDRAVAENLLANMLQKENKTLERTWTRLHPRRTRTCQPSACLDWHDEPMKTVGCTPTYYYLSLNSLGRKKVLDQGFTKTNYVSLLHDAITSCKETDRHHLAAEAKKVIAAKGLTEQDAERRVLETKEVRYIFGLLLENPTLWAV